MDGECTRYVQHTSGLGLIRCVVGETSSEWFTATDKPVPHELYLRLPKSEFRCISTYEDVTEACFIVPASGQTIMHGKTPIADHLGMYRLVLVVTRGDAGSDEHHAFVVERLVEPLPLEY